MDATPKTPPEWKFDRKFGFRRADRKVCELWEYVYLACEEGQRSVESLLRNPILYRGQSDDWPLVPKIGRKDPVYAKKLEVAALRELKIRGPLLLGGACRPESDLEWLSLAQHHGMATRLLDWTENALVALWFAVLGTLRNHSQPVVWVLMPSQRDVVGDEELREPGVVWDITRTRVIFASHAHERVRAQGGWFTLHHVEHDSFPPLEGQREFQHSTDGNFASLGRIDIEPNYTPRLWRQLANCGISAASVYPDMGGLCQQITEQMRG